jgi:integrase
MFKWAVENELVPPSVLQALKAVNGLRRGRTGARESAPVRPVPDAFVDAVRPHVPRQVWAMIELQRLTGMRPGEVLTMRTKDLDTARSVWTYTPSTHKAEHHDRTRTVYLGPKAQEVLRPWLRTDLGGYLFSPKEAMEERWAGQRRDRKTRLTPSQRARTRKAAPNKTPGERYTPDSYRQCIQKACRKAGVPAWHPHQLRHNAATKIRREHGIEVARILLGHSTAFTTEIYAEVDRAKAVRVMADIG